MFVKLMVICVKFQKRVGRGYVLKLIPRSPSELAVTLAGTGDPQLVLAPGEAHYLNGVEQTRGMLVALAERGWGPHTLYLLVPRSSAIRRSGSTSPLGFARASPSPPSHAEHGAALARKLSLGGGRPYTPSPQGEPVYCWETQPLSWDWVSPPWGRGGSCSPSHVDPGNFSFLQVGTIPERPGWSGAPSPQASEMRGGRSPRPGGCSPSLIDGFEGGAGEGQRSWA